MLGIGRGMKAVMGFLRLNYQPKFPLLLFIHAHTYSRFIT